MKKKILLILLLLICYLKAEKLTAADFNLGYSSIAYAIVKDKLYEKPLLQNFCKMFNNLPIGEGGFYEEDLNVKEKIKVLEIIKSMIEEMDVYFEKNKEKLSKAEVTGISSIGDDLIFYYKLLEQNDGYSGSKGPHVAERDNYNLSPRQMQKYGRIVNKWGIEFRIRDWAGDRVEAEKLVKAQRYLYSRIPRRIEESKKIMKDLFDSKKYKGLASYFIWHGKFGQGDRALTNFYQNYKIPKQLYTNGYLPKYLDKLEGFYKNEVVIKKNKMSRWKRLITTLPEEEILENIEEERKKYKKWQKGKK